MDKEGNVRTAVGRHLIGERDPRIGGGEIGLALHDISLATEFIARPPQNDVAALDGDFAALQSRTCEPQSRRAAAQAREELFV